ncbi:HNH endonuclease signature motif containing protein [Rhodococcus sp. MS13]|uniref:HNH endonuclease n=1 Tax=Rhodococcus sp. MS13 TaxID=2579940 RepID=UPI001562C503|nr:HNH endonuclease signature motif containing protein [Rhodococcus sp. MS13]
MTTRGGGTPRRSAADPVWRGPGGRNRNVDIANNYDPKIDAARAAARAAARPTPEQAAILAAKRRHWDRISRRLRPIVLAEYGELCWLCQGAPGTTIDHVTPLSKGGAVDDLANLRPCCSNCNYRRGDMDADAFRSILRAERPKVRPSRNWFG